MENQRIVTGNKNNMKYKIGQRVKIIGGEGFDVWSKSEACLDKVATITGIYESYILDDNEWDINFQEKWLEPVMDDHEEHVRIHTKAAMKQLQENPKKEGGEKHMAFTVGDIVEAIGSCGNGSYEGNKGVVESYGDGIRVRYDEGSSTCENHMDNWKLVSNAKKTMANFIELTKEQKVAFTKEQQSLYKVGLVDSCGNAIQSEVIKALLKVNYKALVGQAEADIAEQEAEELAAKAVK